MLTIDDKGEIQGIITANNDTLMSRIIDVLSNFPTKDDLRREIESLRSELASKAELNELKDELLGIRSDLSTFMEFTNHNIEGHEYRISRIETNLNIKN